MAAINNSITQLPKLLPSKVIIIYYSKHGLAVISKKKQKAFMPTKNYI